MFFSCTVVSTITSFSKDFFPCKETEALKVNAPPAEAGGFE
jgi:hypothetical protein